MPRKPPLLFLGCLFLIAHCVTEIPHQPIVVSGRGVYPPTRLYGTWKSGPDEIVFQRPPRPAFVQVDGDRILEYDVVRMSEERKDYFLFRLEPARGAGGPTIERFFVYHESYLLEYAGDGNRRWQRDRL